MAAGPGEAERDPHFMRRALELAERGWGRVSPNPLVGAVVVRDGEVVGEGWHGEYGGPHAEVHALRAAGERARGATLYVTLEPCAHHGQTPPCTDAVVAAGVTRLVYACADANPRARGGAAVLRERGVRVDGGVEQLAGRDLIAPFLHAHDPAAPRRPWVELKLALSLDARVADAGGGSTWITGEEARAEVHRLRAGFDAVAVGIGTALADDPLLTARGAVESRVPPARIVFDRRLRLPERGRLLATVREAPVWLVHGRGAEPARQKELASRGATLVPADSLDEALAALRERGVTALLCEGGAALAGSLLRDRAVDRLTLLYAPVLLGAGGRAPFAGVPDAPIAQAHRWRLLRRTAFGADTLISMAP
jgi:diaminohydroxyphosphoribosylaminopyrimidine deaminase / 5-amino-6-(5-phosphoribosylamino)uracil reductase